jgi:hypothetical protein
MPQEIAMHQTCNNLIHIIVTLDRIDELARWRMKMEMGIRSIGMWTGIAALFIGAAGCGVPTTAAGTTNAENAATANHAQSTNAGQAGSTGDLASFAGKGNVALIYNEAKSQSANGGKLYTVIGDSEGETPKEYFIVNHVVSATFSPDGKWIAVITIDSPASASNGKQNSNVQPVSTLWLMSADGVHKQKITSGNFIPGTWVASGNAAAGTAASTTPAAQAASAASPTYVYGTNSVYTVQPGGHPVRLSVQLPKGAIIGQYEASIAANKVAIVTTQPTPGKDVTERFDSIDMLNPETGAVDVLKKGQPSDGYVLGPWLNSKSVFYWLAPMHSASLLADGAELSILSMDGKTQNVTTTLVGKENVVTSGSGKAVIQAGAGRALFTSKEIELWDGQTLKSLPHANNGVAIWPAVDGSGKQIAFDQGPELPAGATEAQAQAWWQELQLVTYDDNTHQSRVIAAAGDGVTDPHFDKSGDAVIYLEGNSLNWVQSDGTGQAHKVVTFPGTVWKPYPQDGVSTSLDIADYHP